MQQPATAPDIKKFLDIKAVCAVLGIAQQTLYKMIQRNRGPRTRRIGRLIRIHPDDFQLWLDNPERTPPRKTRKK